MNYEGIELTERDYFLLGTLAERTADTSRALGLYTDDEIERHVRRGYLERLVDGTGSVRYDVTEKGRAAWQAYQFPVTLGR